MIWNMIHRTAIYNGLHLTHLVAIIVLLPTYSSTAVNICPKSLQLKSVQNDLLNIQQSNVFSVDINNPRKTICVPASCKLLCVKQHGHLTTFAWCIDECKGCPLPCRGGIRRGMDQKSLTLEYEVKPKIVHIYEGQSKYIRRLLP